MKFIGFFVLCLFAFGYFMLNHGLFWSTSESSRVPSNARVLSVIDGDTVDVMVEGKKERIRLLGIDAPEMGFEGKKEMCFAKESRNALVELIGDQTIIIASDSSQADRDGYNRLLRYISLPDGTLVNKRMVEEGYAREYVFKSLPYQQRQEFQDAQQKAESEHVGMWKEGECRPF